MVRKRSSSKGNNGADSSSNNSTEMAISSSWEDSLEPKSYSGKTTSRPSSPNSPSSPQLAPSPPNPPPPTTHTHHRQKLDSRRKEPLDRRTGASGAGSGSSSGFRAHLTEPHEGDRDASEMVVSSYAKPEKPHNRPHHHHHHHRHKHRRSTDVERGGHHHLHR